ncbi:hypothetical protein LXL04_029176 [Taraxacum kok-saghyz]
MRLMFPTPKRSIMKAGPQSHLQSWNLFNECSLFGVFLLLVVSLEVIESRFLVKSLPGFLGDFPFTLETGYIGVGESDDVQLFYYFVESEGNPEDDPLMLWLTGGPGCSALSGLLYEIGPFTINYANSTLEKPMLEINPYSWTKAANIIFLDQPAGSGFSYAKTPEAYITNDTLSTMHTYQFLTKWLVDHPKFLNNPLYLGSDSYGGIVVPMIVQEIFNGNEVGEGPHTNIKGYVLGNPLTDTNGDYNSRIPFCHRMGLLSDAIYKNLERIRKPHILEPFCDISNALKYVNLRRRGLTAHEKTPDILLLPQFQIQGCRDDNYLYSYTWANSRDVREALHIREEFEEIEWVRCNESLKFDYDKEAISYTHNVLSTVSYHQQLSNKNSRALVYRCYSSCITGDHDMVVPYMGTLNWIESLNLLVVDDWRPWFVDEQVAGYTMKYLNHDYSLTFATVKGGGHTAPEYKPKECVSMLMRWLADDPLTRYPYMTIAPLALSVASTKLWLRRFANRLKRVVGSVIGDVQTTFISGRNILDGPFIINEVCSWAKKVKQKLFLLKVDFDKAFDSINWGYLDFVMAQMGFSNKWRFWIWRCISSARPSVILNGSPTKEFPISRGLRQGDQLSPFLFIIAMEVLTLP